MASTSISTKRAAALMHRIKSMGEKHRHKIQHAQRGLVALGDSAVVQVGAFGMGMAQGRFGEKKLGPIPVELAAGAALHAAAVMASGKSSGKGTAHQLHNIANGVIAAWSSAIGRGVGKKARAKAGLPLLAGVDRALDQLSGEDKGGGMQDDAELARLARRM
jgi:hypothetical protein